MSERYPKEIQYSEKYVDGKYEYRHVFLPEVDMKRIPPELYERLLNEMEWRSLGVQQSRGWEHYTWHRPEKHILMFRRPLGTNPESGLVDPDKARQAQEAYKASVILSSYPTSNDNP